MTAADLSVRAKALLSVPLALFVGFFLFYFCAAQQLRNTSVYERDDVFFRADTERAFKDLIGERGYNHIHTSGHPNFVILHSPEGLALRDFIKSRTKGMRKLEAAKSASIIMTSLAGAGTVTLLYGLLISCGLPRLRASLFACVLGCSAVQIFYSSTPETYGFSALGLTAVAFLASRRDIRDRWWQVAAVYAWSALTTNIAVVGIWSLVRYWQSSWKAMALKLIKVMTITVLIMVALSVVQKMVYPKSVIFFMPHAVERESGWFYWERFLQPVETSRILLQHQWLSNIIAPEPVMKIMFGEKMASIEDGTWAMVAPSAPLLALWVVVLGAAATSLRHRSFYQPVVLAGMGAMAFNFAFFFVFGHDRMLYAALWTSTTVCLVALGVEELLRRCPKLVPSMTAALVVLVAGEAWHNWHFLGKIAELVK
jgi:hypothetical protein